MAFHLAGNLTDTEHWLWNVNMHAPVQKRGDEANATKFIKASLERWGAGRKDVTEKTMKFLRS